MGIRKWAHSFITAPDRVYVLGAGPAGLLAAHAAEEADYEVIIFSNGDEHGPRKSELFGCQYLHRAIPYVTGAAGRGVRYRLTGDPMDYREKVYGGAWDGSVSPDEYGPEQNHMAWDLRAAYDKLWQHWASRIVTASITPESMRTYTTDTKAFTVNTIPAPAVCLDMEHHKFNSRAIWAMGSTGDEDGRMPYCAPDMTVECDGTRDRGWYRAATVFGHSTLEWPLASKPPIAGVARVSKPLSTDCTCHLNERYLRVGRYGTWAKGVLVHTAYEKTRDWLA